MTFKYILLMRHGEHEAAGPSDRPIRRLTDRGKKETAEVAEHLGSVIKELGKSEQDRISIGAVWCATTEEAQKTEKVVQKTLNGQVVCEAEDRPDLNPDEFGAYENTGASIKISRELKKRAIGLADDYNAILVVGHQPLLGWLAGELIVRRMKSLIRKGLSTIFPSAGAIPIARSELICIAFGGKTNKKLTHGRLRWVLSPYDPEAIDEIKEKIRSKMDIAKVLSVFITTALTILLGLLVDQEKVDYIGNHLWSIYVSAGLFFAAVALYLATLYAYDRMLMPIRFWGQTPPPENIRNRPKWLVWRPPSSPLWVLYQNMMRVWRYLFSTATVAVILGLLFLAFGVFKICNPLLFFSIALLGLILLLLYLKHFGPRLGAED